VGRGSGEGGPPAGRKHGNSFILTKPSIVGRVTGSWGLRQIPNKKKNPKSLHIDTSSLQSLSLWARSTQARRSDEGGEPRRSSDLGPPTPPGVPRGEDGKNSGTESYRVKRSTRFKKGWQERSTMEETPSI